MVESTGGTAVAVAKAMDMAIGSANLVTVSLFNERMAAVDAKFAELRVELKEVEAKLICWSS